MPELKKCPFCGNKTHLQNGNNQFPHTEYQYKVHCGFCGGTTCFHANQESAIKTWDTRPIESDLERRLDIAIKGLLKLSEVMIEQNVNPTSPNIYEETICYINLILEQQQKGE